MPEKDKTKKVIRLHLGQDIIDLIEQMKEELKNDEKYCSISNAQIVSYALDSFYKSLFKKEKSQIILLGFDSKRFLTDAISNISEEDNLKDFLEMTLKRVNSKGKKRRSKQPKEQSVSTNLGERH